MRDLARPMRVLMFGWEFPPHVSGGLGVACEGLVRGLLEIGTDVTLVLPREADPSSFPGSASSFPSGGRARRGRSARRRRPAAAPHPDPAAALRHAARPPVRAARRTEARRGSGRPVRPRPAAGRPALRRGGRPDRRPGAVRRHPRARLADVPRRGRGAPVERTAPRRPRPRDGVRPRRRRRRRPRRRDRAARPRRGRPRDRRVAIHRRRRRPGVRRRPGERLRVVHNAIEPRGEPRRWPSARRGARHPLRRAGSRGRKDPSTSSKRRRASPRSVRTRTSSSPGSGDRCAAMIERVAAASLSDRFLFTGLSAAGGARPSLCASRRLRDAVRLRAVRPDGARGAPARDPGHRLALRPASRRSSARAPGRLRRRRGPRLQDPVGAAFEPLRRALSARGLAEVRALSWTDPRRPASRSTGNLVGDDPASAHDPGLPLFPGPSALPAAPLQLLRRRARAPILRRRGNRDVLARVARRCYLPAPRCCERLLEEPSALRGLLLPFGHRPRAAARRGARGARGIPAARRVGPRRVPRPRPRTTRSRGSLRARSSPTQVALHRRIAPGGVRRRAADLPQHRADLFRRASRRRPKSSDFAASSPTASSRSSGRDLRPTSTGRRRRRACRCSCATTGSPTTSRSASPIAPGATWPLTAEKYDRWISGVGGRPGLAVHGFRDVRRAPVPRDRDLRVLRGLGRPAARTARRRVPDADAAIARFEPRETLSSPRLLSWADEARDSPPGRATTCSATRWASSSRSSAGSGRADRPRSPRIFAASRRRTTSTTWPPRARPTHASTPTSRPSTRPTTPTSVSCTSSPISSAAFPALRAAAVHPEPSRPAPRA